MKKLFVLFTLLFAYSVSTALEPVRVAIVTTSGNTLEVNVELFDYSTNTSLYTQSLGALTANSSGIISFIVDGGAPAWSGILASAVNSNVVLNVKTGVAPGTLYAQYRLDNLMLVQAQSGSGVVTVPATAGKLINISAANVISKINNLQVATMSASVAVNADSSPEGIFRFDMTAPNNTFAISGFNNPVDGGVYTFHFVNAAGGTVTLPASFKKEDGTALGSITVINAKMLTFYHYQGTNYTLEQ